MERTKHPSAAAPLSITAITQVSMCTALLAVMSQLSIPLPIQVPLTFQCFTVTLILLLLGFRKGLLSIVVFLALGALGLPIFANGKAGLSALTGPTGGYLWGFLLMALVIGPVRDRTGKWPLLSGAILAGLLLDYVWGVLQLKQVLSLSFSAAMASGFYPFIAKDVILCLLALALARLIWKRVPWLKRV